MNELQRKMLSLLKEIDNICRENNIHYFLHGGTAIGAIRHRGFIPWDDDLDIIFTRDNWNKFCSIVKKERPDRHLSCLENDEKYYNIWAKYVDPGTTYIFPTAICGEEVAGGFIDIGILDICPNSERQKKKMVRRMVDYGEYVNNNYYITNRSLASANRNKCWEIAGKIIGRNRMIKYLSKSVQKYNKKSYDYMIQNSPTYPAYWNKCFFDEAPIYVPFEDTTMPVVNNVGEWLRETYGDDWYFLPHISGRTGHIGVWTMDFPAALTSSMYAPYLNIKRIKEMRRSYKKYRLKAVKYENIVRISNSKRMALADSLYFKHKLDNITFDLYEAFKKSKYWKITEFFKIYLEEQFQPRFIKDSILIEIEQKPLFIICMTMAMTGYYHKALKLMELNFESLEEAPELFNEAVELISISRELSVALYDKKDWETAEEIANKWLNIYPHHIDFFAVDVTLRIKRTEKISELKKIQQEVYNEYMCHPDSPVLHKLRADIQLKLGKYASAEKNYQRAYEKTDNGMLRLEIVDIATLHRMKVEKDNDIVKNLEEIEKNPNSQKELDYIIEKWRTTEAKNVQSIIFSLLCEMREVCIEENISFFLGGYLAEGAKKYGSFFKGSCTAYVIMHPKEREHFLSAMRKKLPNGRVLESFETNRNYPDFSIRYTDITTLFFNVREEGFYKHEGISVTIYFMRPEHKNRRRRKFNNGFYASIEANAFKSVFYNYTRKRIVAGILGKAMMLVFGKKRTKRIAWKLLYGFVKSDVIKRGSIKSMWFRKIPLGLLDFSKKEQCILNGIEFPIPFNYNNYIKPQIKKTFSVNEKVGIQIGLPYIIDSDICCSEYSEKLKNLNICRKYCSAAAKLKRINSKANKSKDYLHLAWAVTLRGLDRLLLWKKYMPQKRKIMALRASGNFKALEGVLATYINKIRDYKEWDMPIAFDNDIFRITWELLEKKGQGELIESTIHKMPKKYYKQIRYRKEIKQEPSSIRRAIRQEQKQILEYLREDLNECWYIYADISKYGLENSKIKVWYDTDRHGIRNVIVKKDNNFKLYGNRGFDDIEDIIKLVKKEKPLRIFAGKELAHAIKLKIGSSYHSIYEGTILERIS